MPANAELTQIKTDITQQQGVINSLESVLNSKCNNASVFSPTVFQSNLFAPNWILGKQTITNLVDQYYQRTQLYRNVNNCPLIAPFYNGTACIQCNGTLDIFNMYINRCEKCPSGFKIHPTQHTCSLVPHYSNFNNVTNYALAGASGLPTIPTGVTSCPSTQPFWNGTSCLKCSLPQYWNVNKKQCQSCSPGLVFDPNLKNCTLPQNNTLTFLFGKSRWVTAPGNLSNVLAARAKAITGKNYTICSKATPYFDGIHCINCSFEFNLTSRTCVKAPVGYAFDLNTHSYVKIQPNMTTNPNATNYISAVPLNTTNATGNHCNSSKPYYDGVACIACSTAFPYFNVSSKLCVQCSATRYYDNKTHQCLKRPVVFISANFSNVMATPNLSLPAYKQQLYNMVANNNNSIIRACPPGEYSNFTNCFNCSKGQYFNIETKKCASCNGTINNVTFLCQHFKTMLTNPNVTNLILPLGTNLTQFHKLQQQVVGPNATCPPTKPYSIGYACVACNVSNTTGNVYFSVVTKNCVVCPPNLFFNSVTQLCNKAINITNTSALVNYIGTGNNSLANLTSRLQTLSQTRKTIICPSSKPFAVKNGSCVACGPGEFANLSSSTCNKSMRISNIQALTKLRVFQNGTYNLTNLIKN